MEFGQFGVPVNEAFWAANNPACIVADDPQRIRESGLKIYLEVGTDDSLGNHHNVEFLHRVMFDHGVKHEYRTVLGADHVGATLAERTRYALRFLQSALHPPAVDPAVAPVRAMMAARYKQAGIAPPPD